MLASRLAAAIGLFLVACSGTDPHDELTDLANAGASCSADEECCVVFDECTGDAFVVGRADFDDARELAESAGTEDVDRCVGCSPVRVEVACVKGRCLGLDVRGAGSGSSTAHCGPIGDADVHGGTGVILGCR